MVNTKDTDLFDVPEYEKVCQECSQTFLTSDENEEWCPECWKKIVSLNNEGKDRT